MSSWRPDASLLPPQRPANASMEQLLQYVPKGGTAWLAFGNSGVTEMLLNWVHHVIALRKGHAMVVACYDDGLFVQLRHPQKSPRRTRSHQAQPSLKSPARQNRPHRRRTSRDGPLPRLAGPASTPLRWTGRTHGLCNVPKIATPRRASRW